MSYITHSSQVRSITLRDKVRHVGLSTLAHFEKLHYSLKQARKDPRVQFIYLHHVFSDEEKGFHQLIVSLSKYYTIISYSEAVERILNGKIDGPYLCISFDDGFKNCRQAAKILNEFGLSACFFICPPL